MRTSLVILAALALLCGCSQSEYPPAKGNYSLSWYPREGTDYGPHIPGFKTLEMCRRAGVGMTMERLIERHGVQPNFDYADKEPHPWFECGTDCRPYQSGSYLLVCHKIAEFHGRDAETPH